MASVIKLESVIFCVFLVCINGLSGFLLGDQVLEDSEKTGIIANTSHGRVRGFLDNATTVAKFHGIPYAKAPTGKLLFKAPVSPDSWPGIRDATKFGNKCPQQSEPEQDEDCLYLNVYAPTWSTDQSRGVPGEGQAAEQGLPVMVWIHGGSFKQGAGSDTDGTVLARKGVVIITLNYRLGVFGFLSTGDEAIPGNFGLMDQLLALRWVQENIHAFGGDPGRVTLFGESAGGSCVSLLVLSPLSKGLFQNAIVQSGGSLNYWTFQHPARRISQRQSSRLIGNAVGCPHLNDNEQLLECLQKVDVNVLFEKTEEVRLALGEICIVLPVVETIFGVLPDLPIKLLAKGDYADINTLQGYNTDEMGWKLNSLIKDQTNINVDFFTNALLEQLQNFAILDVHEIVSATEKIYLEGIDMNNTDAIKSVTLQMLTDLMYKLPALMEANLLSKSSSHSRFTPSMTTHYVYEFNHRPATSGLPAWISAAHMEELPYLFGLQGNQSKEERMISRLMMDLWTSFAKTGEPTSSLLLSEWMQYSSTTQGVLVINNTPEMVNKVTNLETLKLYSLLLQRIATTENFSYSIFG